MNYAPELGSGRWIVSPAETAAGQILIVDDDPEIRDVLRKILHAAKYHVDEAATAEDGLRKLRERQPDLVLLDIGLPDRNGHEVLEEIRADPLTRVLPVVMLTVQATREEKLRAGREGVTDFLAKPVSADELVPRVRSLVMLKHFADEHEHAEHVILMLARTIDARDPYTAGHSGRVAEYSDRIGQRMGMDTAERLDMRRGALFHDLGKIVVPDEILHKPGPLTRNERSVIEQHPTVGHELLSPMRTMRKTLPGGSLAPRKARRLRLSGRNLGVRNLDGRANRDRLGHLRRADERPRVPRRPETRDGSRGPLRGRPQGMVGRAGLRGAQGDARRARTGRLGGRIASFEAEEAGARLAARVAARAAHDLNNALAVFSGHIYLLRESAEPVSEALDAMEKAAENVKRSAKNLSEVGFLSASRSRRRSR